MFLPSFPSAPVAAAAAAPAAAPAAPRKMSHDERTTAGSIGANYSSHGTAQPTTRVNKGSSPGGRRGGLQRLTSLAAGWLATAAP